MKIVAVLAALGLLLGLGTWQLDRLAWKRQLIATMESRMAQPAVAVQDLTGDADYRRATAHGYFEAGTAFYLFAVAADGRGGYHQLVPLRLDHGRVLLVDRGWLPYDAKGRITPPDGPVTLGGILRRPTHPWSQPANDPARGDWYGVDLSAMARLAGIGPFLPYVLEVEAGGTAYPQGGQTRVTLANNHLGYALTWYGLAVALLVIIGLERRANKARSNRVSSTTAPA
jgi:surfeit locus 1 family protein